MAIQIKIDATENRGDFNKIYFTLEDGSKDYKFTADLSPTEDFMAWTEKVIDKDSKKNKDWILELIKGKIEKGTYKNEHPSWIELDKEINNATTIAQLKAVLKKAIKDK